MLFPWKKLGSLKYNFIFCLRVQQKLQGRAHTFLRMTWEKNMAETPEKVLPLEVFYSLCFIRWNYLKLYILQITLDFCFILFHILPFSVCHVYIICFNARLIYIILDNSKNTKSMKTIANYFRKCQENITKHFQIPYGD